MRLVAFGRITIIYKDRLAEAWRGPVWAKAELA